MNYGSGSSQCEWHNVLIIRMVNIENQAQLQILLNFVKEGKYGFIGTKTNSQKKV